MWHCCLKIVYYIGLIIYHCVDIFSDWNEFKVEIHDHGRFAGVPTNSSTVEDIVIVSCIFGSICSVLIWGVYFYYIYFHLKCICKSSYRLLERVHYQDTEGDTLLTCTHDNESQPAICNRHVVCAEMIISNIELFKEGLQCGLLLYFALENNRASIQPDWPDILFAVCSAVGNSKLLICFLTKFYGKGSGETAPHHESAKGCWCMLCCLVSLIFIGLTVFYLGKAS